MKVKMYDVANISNTLTHVILDMLYLVTFYTVFNSFYRFKPSFEVLRVKEG